MAFEVTVKEATGVSPFKQLDNKKSTEALESRIKQKLDLAEERRKVGSMICFDAYHCYQIHIRPNIEY